MKMREVINLIDPDKMEVSDFREIIGPDGNDPMAIENHAELVQTMYTDHVGDERDSLTLAKMRADIRKLNAEIIKLRAAARKDNAAVNCDYQREGSKRKS